jgi:putative iron-dependent peroxidase
MSPLSLTQAAVLAPVPAVGRYLFYSVKDGLAVRDHLRQLAHVVDGLSVLVGLGPELVDALGAEVPGLHPLVALEASGVELPSTPTSLCVWLRGADPGDVLHLTRRVEALLSPAFHLDQSVDAFRHGKGPNGHGRDVTGYEDGVEHPDTDAALAAAVLQGGGPGLDGSSFMAVQQWVHNLDAFEAMTSSEQDLIYGRRRIDNVELEEAPASAHVKRVKQAHSQSPAFGVSRSMPWSEGQNAGWMSVSFGASFDAFEVLMRCMAGLDDGVTDALFTFSKPVTGAFFWCPPMQGGRLDLRHVGL